MKRLKDYAKIGSVADVKANLDDLGKKLRDAGRVLLPRHDLGVGCRVYPEIARSTAEQLQLLAKLLEKLSCSQIPITLDPAQQQESRQSGKGTEYKKWAPT